MKSWLVRRRALGRPGCAPAMVRRLCHDARRRTLPNATLRHRNTVAPRTGPRSGPAGAWFVHRSCHSGVEQGQEEEEVEAGARGTRRGQRGDEYVQAFDPFASTGSTHMQYSGSGVFDDEAGKDDAEARPSPNGYPKTVYTPPRMQNLRRLVSALSSSMGVPRYDIVASMLDEEHASPATERLDEGADDLEHRTMLEFPMTNEIRRWLEEEDKWFESRAEQFADDDDLSEMQDWIVAIARGRAEHVPTPMVPEELENAIYWVWYAKGKDSDWRALSALFDVDVDLVKAIVMGKQAEMEARDLYEAGDREVIVFDDDFADLAANVYGITPIPPYPDRVKKYVKRLQRTVRQDLVPDHVDRLLDIRQRLRDRRVPAEELPKEPPAGLEGLRDSVLLMEAPGRKRKRTFRKWFVDTSESFSHETRPIIIEDYDGSVRTASWSERRDYVASQAMMPAASRGKRAWADPYDPGSAPARPLPIAPRHPVLVAREWELIAAEAKKKYIRLTDWQSLSDLQLDMQASGELGSVPMDALYGEDDVDEELAGNGYGGLDDGVPRVSSSESHDDWDEQDDDDDDDYEGDESLFK